MKKLVNTIILFSMLTFMCSCSTVLRYNNIRKFIENDHNEVDTVYKVDHCFKITNNRYWEYVYVYVWYHKDGYIHCNLYIEKRKSIRYIQKIKIRHLLKKYKVKAENFPIKYDIRMDESFSKSRYCYHTRFLTIYPKYESTIMKSFSRQCLKEINREEGTLNYKLLYDLDRISFKTNVEIIKGFNKYYFRYKSYDEIGP